MRKHRKVYFRRLDGRKARPCDIDAHLHRTDRFRPGTVLPSYMLRDWRDGIDVPGCFPQFGGGR